MTLNIKNIYCVGRNYIEHAMELNNAVPESPLLFMKPSHAVVEAKGQEIFLPSTQGGVHFEVELVVHMARSYEPGIAVDDLIDSMAIGLDLTLRDVQTEMKQKGYPWLPAKGFLNSAVITPWQPFPGIKTLEKQDFSLIKNGKEVQRGNIKEMIFDIPTLLAFTARNLGLGEGDIFFTGTPEGVGPLADGDQLVLKWGEESLGNCFVRIR